MAGGQDSEPSVDDGMHFLALQYLQSSGRCPSKILPTYRHESCRGRPSPICSIAYCLECLRASMYKRSRFLLIVEERYVIS